MIPITVSKSFRSKKDDATPPPRRGRRPAPSAAARRGRTRSSSAASSAAWASRPSSCSSPPGVVDGGPHEDARRPSLRRLVVGLLALFSLKVATQWERAVVLRFGTFHGLKGPGLFVVDPGRRRGLAARRPARPRDGRDGRVGPDEGHGARERRRDRLLDRLGREEVGPRGGGLPRRRLVLGADGAARDDRPPHARRDDHRARAAREASSRRSSTRRRTRGGSPCSPSRSAT